MSILWIPYLSFFLWAGEFSLDWVRICHNQQQKWPGPTLYFGQSNKPSIWINCQIYYRKQRRYLLF
jgi:hypothetical protein